MIVLMMSSCSNFYGDKNLGSGYFLWQDGRYKEIVFSTEKVYKGEVIYNVIEENVSNVNFNDSYIIVKTSKFIDPKTELTKFWVIDKTVSINLNNCHDQASCDKLLKINVTGPMDSISFYQKLKKLNIGLKFKREIY